MDMKLFKLFIEFQFNIFSEVSPFDFLLKTDDRSANFLLL